jgi:hypothetical protein
MSRDLKEIFDLDHIKRLWGDDVRRPSPSVKSADPVAPPKPTAPLLILEELEVALTEEFDGQRRPLFQPTLEAIRSLVGIGGMSELDAERSAVLGKHLDELEDLLDTLSLAQGSPSAAS